jgi:hypothetical protein
MSLHINIETIAAEQLVPHFETMFEINGVPASVKRPNRQTAEHEVYGEYAGTTHGDSSTFNTTVVYGEEGWATSGQYGNTLLEQIFLFSKDVLQTGDIVTVTRADTKKKSYKVLPLESPGILLDISTRYSAVAIEL